MKRCCLLVMLVAIPVFAGQVTYGLAESPAANAEVLPVQFAPTRGETLKYDNNNFDNGVGIYTSGSPQYPLDWEQLGFATYFELHEFGILDSRKLTTVLVYFNSASVSTFRLFVWNNVTYGMLRPQSHYIVHPCSILGAPMPPAGTWGAFDVTSYNIILPDTFWIGVCYNEILQQPNASWYLGICTSVYDNHTYINLSGGPAAWELETQFPNAFGVRAVVDMLAMDVATVSIDIPASVPPGTILGPQATVKNYGTETATSFDVTCEIEPGGYSSTENIGSLASGDSIQVAFSPDFTFESGIYTVTVYTDLSGDENPGNDTLVAEIDATGIAEQGGDVLVPYGFRAPTISKGNAHIQFTLASATMVELAVYDALGRLRTTLISNRLSAGYHSIDAQFNLPTGVYFYNMKTGLGEQVMEKFLLMK